MHGACIKIKLECSPTNWRNREI